MIKIVIQLIGGLGLFLYGMKLMSDGLENAAGERLKTILEKVTSNRLIGVGIGAAVTSVVQSSSATTVMVIGFVNAGLMNLSQAIGVIMGANIGTTITTQLIAFKLDNIAPLFVFAGTLMVIVAKVKKRREIGNIVLGFGILFMGMGIMSTALEPIAASALFTKIIISIGNNWVIGILLGLFITGIVQSSSATTGMLIALASTGAININVAIPIVFGCNIGTCVTAMLASIGTNKTARKAALLHLMFNVVGTLIFIPLLGILGDFAQFTSNDISRQIANAHTTFNVISTILLLPFSNYMVNFSNKVIPGTKEIENFSTKYIDDRVLETPVIAVGQVTKETIRMANKAKTNVELSMKAFINNDESLVNEIYENEKLINILDQAITTYLVKLSKCELSDKENEIIDLTFHLVIDIERIGDHAKNIADLALEKTNKHVKYSNYSTTELFEMYNSVMEALNIAIDSYETRNINKAKNFIDVEAKIDIFQKNYREQHIQRMCDGECNAFAGAIFLDLITDFERIGDHSTNITKRVLENCI